MRITTIYPINIIAIPLAKDDPRIDILCEYCLGAILSSIIYWYEYKPFTSEKLASLLYNLMTVGIFSVLE